MEDNNQNNEQNNNQNQTVQIKKSTLKYVGIAIAVVLVLVGVYFAGKASNGNNENNNSVAQTATTNTNTGTSTSTQTGTNTATTNTTGTKTENIVGKYYNQVALRDQNSGADVFKTLLPDGWKASVTSNYSCVAPDYPVLFSVSIQSPDGKALITIDSPQQFCESPTRSEGINISEYTTYLHYMTADQFVEYFMSQAYPNASLLKSLETDNTLLSELRSYQKMKADKTRQNMQQLFSGIQYGNYSGSVTELEVTASKRQYQTQDGYLEGTCVVVPFSQTISSTYLSTTNTWWEIPYSMVYFAADKDTFDKYYDDYNFIIANSQFTVDAYTLIEYVANRIANVVTAEAAAKSQASLNAMNEYIDSNYSSTSAASTNEKVMQMWDDVINEVDTYNTTDGGQVKTSMYNDIVAQDGDKFFVGSSTSDIPIGYTQLQKAY